VVNEIGQIEENRRDERLSARCAIRASVAITSIDDRPVIALATALDLSTDGVAIGAEFDLAVGATVALELAMLDGTPPVKITSEVRYRLSDRVGLAFLAIADEDRLQIERLLSHHTAGAATATGAEFSA
jgi:PilZ domain